MSLPASETFVGAAGALSGSWTQQASVRTIDRDGAGLAMLSAAEPNAEYFAFWSADVFGADQYSQAVPKSLTSDIGYCEVSVRMSGTQAVRNGYLIYTDGVNGPGHTDIFKFVAGVGSTLSSLGAANFAVDDVMRIGAIGTGLAAYNDGVSVGSATDASLTDGAAGVGFYWGEGTPPKLTTWEGGNLGGGVASPPRSLPKAAFFGAF